MSGDVDGRSEEGSVWLVGVRLDPDREPAGEPELYTLLFEAKDEQPVVNRGRVVLFTRPELASLALAMEEDPRVRGERAAPAEVYTVYRLDRALSLLRDPATTHDEEACILDCLNLVFDCVKAVGLTLPADYREPLHGLADHLTFSSSLSELDASMPGWREPALNGTWWCLGAVSANSMVLTSAALDAARRGAV
jgi:hypothetical protein